MQFERTDNHIVANIQLDLFYGTSQFPYQSRLYKPWNF